MTYLETIKRFPFAKYVKYLAGDELTEKQIVDIFNGKKVKCTVSFKYPKWRELEKKDVYFEHSYGGISIKDLYIWVNESRTDLHFEFDEQTLLQYLPPEKDPKKIEMRKLKLKWSVILCIILIALLDIYLCLPS